MHNPLARDQKLEEYAYIVVSVNSEFSLSNILKEKKNLNQIL